MIERGKLTPELIESFAGAFLSPMYDNPKPTPQFHRDGWALYCSDAELASIVAPREHSKSTCFTHDYGLAAALFREADYIVIVSATEDLAIGHLSDIAKELRENDDIIKAFFITKLSVDSKTDIVVDFADGHQCRFVAKGSGQKMRGMKWNGKRPGLILADDAEEDEQVENRDRRDKFQKWFYRALLPCRRRGGKVRIHGTILHESSLLARLQKAKTWKTLFFKAHESFDDFSNALWPEQFPETRLQEIRQSFIDIGDAAGYSQEYLNNPFDNSEAYLWRDDFLPMKQEDHEAQKTIVVGCDFAVSKKDKANRTSFTVAGKCARNLTHFIDQYAGRWDTLEWVDLMFDIQEKYEPDTFYVEDGVIWKSIAPTVYKEMQVRDIWLNCYAINPTRDKATRGRPFQKRMRAHGCRFDTEAAWYPAFEDELLHFTGNSDAVLDDQFDSAAILIKGLEIAPEVEDDDFLDDDEYEMRRHNPQKDSGRSLTTGY